MGFFIILAILTGFIFYMAFRGELSRASLLGKPLFGISSVLSLHLSTTSSALYRGIYFTLTVVILVTAVNYDIRTSFHLPAEIIRSDGNGFYYNGSDVVRYLYPHNLWYYFVVFLSIEAAYQASINKNTFIRIPLGIMIHIWLLGVLLVSNTDLYNAAYRGYSIYSVLILHGIFVCLHYIFTVLSVSLKHGYKKSFLNGLYSNSLLGLYIKTKKARLRKELEEENKKLEKDE